MNHVVEQLVEHLQKAVAKKDKKASNTLKPHQFKQHLWVCPFVSKAMPHHRQEAFRGDEDLMIGV